MHMITAMLVAIFALLATPLLRLVVVSWFLKFLRRGTGPQPNQEHAMFFHPFHSAGGGGERVLWVAVRGLIDRKCEVSIVSAGAACSAGLIKNQFGISFTESEINKNNFVYLPRHDLLDNTRYITAAVLLQNVAGAVLLVFSLFRVLTSNWGDRGLPTIFIDTTGFVFTLPVAKAMLLCKTAAYVHYPTMPREKLREECAFFKNLYYTAFVSLYAVVGRWFVDVAMTNSNWTDERMRDTWKREDTVVVYPPVKISQSKKANGKARQDAVLSLGQFRPEKNHKLQLRVFARLSKKFPGLKFWVVGGARDAPDLERVAELQRFGKELGISEAVEFVVNASREEVERRLETAKVAIHTMIDEHFGISLLEFLAAGLVVVAHRSGGPEKDILVDGAGFLASTEDEYVELISRAVDRYNTTEIQRVIERGYEALDKFNDDNKFSTIFADLVL